MVGATLVVNVLIPKGGIYLHGIPVTWGYLLLGATAAALLVTPPEGRAGWSKGNVLVVAGIVGFGLLAAANIVLRPLQVGLKDDVLPFVVSSVVIPLLSLVVGRRLVVHYGVVRLARTTALLLAAVAAWGVVHFAVMNAFHLFIGVPYVTVTGGHLASVAFKNINRGGVYKLVSTYNNGNIFGVNVLMWFPLVAFTGWSVRSGWITRLALLLTISRTAWIGWLAAEVAGRLASVRRRADLIVLPVILLVALLGITVAAFVWFRHPGNFLFDASLGGRAGQFAGPVTVLGGPFEGIREVVYMSVLHDFGAVGLAVFLAVWSSPLWVPASSLPVRLAKVGLLVYLLIMFSDGAFVLVPTQWTYWTIASIVLFSRDGVHGPPSAPAGRAAKRP